MPEIEFSIEYAKSNRAKCKVSKEVIEKGEMRIAKITEMDRGDGSEPIKMSAWHKVIPFFQMLKRMRKKELVPTDASPLAGFDALEAADRATIEKMIADYHDPDVDFPPKPEKKKAKAEKRDAEDGGDAPDAKPEPKTKKPKLAAIPPEVRESVQMADLRGIAEELCARCRVRGLNVPSDAGVARQKLGPILRDLLTPEGALDVGAALAAAEKEWGAKKEVECANAANGDLAAIFLELSTWGFKQGATMKAVAYKKVSAALAEHGDAITSGKQATKLAGIGKSSAEKIDEFLATGSIAKLEEYKNDV